MGRIRDRQGETKASVVLQGGMQADLRVVEDRSFPFALAYFTGSKGTQYRHAAPCHRTRASLE